MFVKNGLCSGILAVKGILDIDLKLIVSSCSL